MTTRPQTHGTRAVVDGLAASLRAEAEEAHAQYPQYAGHWDGWRVAEVTSRVRTKLGVAFEAGDLVLVSPEVWEDRVIPRGPDKFLPYEQWPLKQFATAYSYRNGIDTSVPVAKVREIRVTEEGS